MPTPEEIIDDVYGGAAPVDICVKVDFSKGTFPGLAAEETTGRLRRVDNSLFFIFIGLKGYQYSIDKNTGLNWTDQLEVSGEYPIFTDVMGRETPWFQPQGKLVYFKKSK